MGAGLLGCGNGYQGLLKPSRGCLSLGLVSRAFYLPVEAGKWVSCVTCIFFTGAFFFGGGWIASL